MTDLYPFYNHIAPPIRRTHSTPRKPEIARLQDSLAALPKDWHIVVPLEDFPVCGDLNQLSALIASRARELVGLFSTRKDTDGQNCVRVWRVA